MKLEAEGTEAVQVVIVARESSEAAATVPESMVVALEACMEGPEAPGGEILVKGAEESTAVRAAWMAAPKEEPPAVMLAGDMRVAVAAEVAQEGVKVVA